MMRTEMKIQETRFDGCYIIEDSGVNYIYDEKKNDLHQASNLEMDFYGRNHEVISNWNNEDNWRWNR